MKLLRFLTTKSAIFLIVFGISGTAFAEYYQVVDYPQMGCYNGCASACYYPTSCGQITIEIRSKTPYRHSTRGSGQMEEYAWVP